MASKGDNATISTPSKPYTTTSFTPVTLDEVESPDEIASHDPTVLPITNRHTSPVWSNFKRKRIDGKDKAECNYCFKLLAGGPRAGTTHLKDHTRVCPKRKCQDLRQTRLFGTQKDVNGSGETLTLAPYEFHQEDGIKYLAEMIILHQYPLNIVTHYGFRKYSNTLQPGFKVPSRNTIRKDIMNRYELEKESVQALLRKAKSRIALTTDMWTSDNQKKGYMAVAAHFIDISWRLQSRIIRFIYVPAPHNAEVLAEALKECIQSWNLDLRLSSITVDNCSTNDAMLEILKCGFPYGSFLLDGEFFHMRCCAHILNLIVQDGLQEVVPDGVHRIRESVVFWTASPKRVQRFEQVANQLVPDLKRKLELDCKTRWNSTYDMLTVDVNYREVFVVLSARDNLYKNPPLPEDWEKVKKICELLEVFHDITLDFSASKYPTANLYFPKICALRLAISEWLSSPYDYVVKMAKVMLEKYMKYWDRVNGLLGVATILDPRYKMALIRFYFFKFLMSLIMRKRLQGLAIFYENWLMNMGLGLTELKVVREQSFDLTSGGKTKGDSFMKEFAQYLEQDRVQSYEKSDLDKYLEDKNVPLVDNFDILNWWKTNGGTYPILQQVARDILSVPVSTVPSESAFSTSDRVLDSYRSRLLPEAVEALMCSQSWIWGNLQGSGDLKVEDFANIVGEKEEEFRTESIDVTCVN